MSARPFHILSYCLAVILVCTLVSLVISSLAITRNTSTTQVDGELLTDGSVPMTASLETQSILPLTDASFNLGIAQRRFENTFTSDIKFGAFVHVDSADEGDLLIFTGNMEIGDSGVSMSNFVGAPFMPIAGGTATGNFNMNEHELQNVNAINGKTVETFVKGSNLLIDGNLVYFSDEFTLSGSSFQGNWLVTTTQNQTANKIVMFGDNNELKDSGFLRNNIVHDNGSSSNEDVAIWQAGVNTIRSSNIKISDFILNEHIPLFMPLVGGTFTSPLEYDGSSSSSPSLLYAYSSYSPFKTLSLIRNAGMVAVLGPFVKAHDPLGQFLATTNGVANGVTFIATSTNLFRVQILLGIQNVAMNGLKLAFEIQTSDSQPVNTSVLNMSATGLGTQYITYETTVRFPTNGSFFLYKMTALTAASGANISVTVTDVSVIVSAI